VINAARNTGGSIGISNVSNVLEHREQLHHGRRAEHAIPSSARYQDTLSEVTHYFVAQGSALIPGATARDSVHRQQIQTRAAFLAYMDAF
jgi:DHA2 family multidrug resistance protein